MKRIPAIACIFLLLYNNAFTQMAGEKILFDFGWKFHRGGAQGAETPAYDDSKWRKLDLPHDWSIENIPGTNSPFDSNAISQVSGGFTTGGTGWYRKTFTLPDYANGKRIAIQFDGIYMNADVYLNGELIGTHPYGYTSFYYDISGKLKANTTNTIAVQVKNEGQNSRWYTGSGIYRHVWLLVNNDVHIANWSTFITTPEVSKASASIKLQSRINNFSKSDINAKAVFKIIGPDEKEAARLESVYPIVADSSSAVFFETTVNNPKLWTIQSPHLYKGVLEVFVNNELTHEEKTSFGIRSLSFDTSGFRLNGETIELKGGCVHHDNGPLGAAAYDRAEIRRVQLLKQSGFNAIRSSHNPPSPAFLDACDSLGMLVIDEAFDMWRNPNNPHDYHLFFDKWWKEDINSLVLRDRNHPSVILWSIGNEIKGMNTPEVTEVAKMLTAHVKTLDTTRPVTAAINGLSPDKDNFISALDIAGYNYAAQGDHNQADIYAADHKRLPNRIMFGSESYAMAAFQSWKQAAEKPWVLGDFVWTAFDYIGEASIGWRGYYQKSDFYPWNLAFCGDIDICGWKRPQSYYRDVLWKKDELSLFVTPPVPSFPANPAKEYWSRWEWHDAVADWNWEEYEGKPIEIQVYSSCDRVELFLNGKSLGSKNTNEHNEYLAKWTVPYEKGELSAVGYNGKKKIKTVSLKSAGDADRLRLSADRQTIKADGQDLVYITIELKDKNGVTVPKAENKIMFTVEGAGMIAGMGNADPMSVESFQGNERKLWRGKCLLIIRSRNEPGDIKITAHSKGLPDASIPIGAE
ncbi:MAG: DUF4982 domain-containing protein [Chitinophagaceae bacterium]|nr:DUF4982 domain-containing protein [Chitinophagaceae bacterium]